METTIKQFNSPRFKSSEVLTSILKQNREINKKYYIKPSHQPPISPDYKTKVNFFDNSYTSLYNYSDHTNKSSQMSIRPTKTFIINDINKKLEKKTHNAAFFERNSPKQQLEKKNREEINIHAVTPDFFRKALYSILKVPSSSRSQRRGRRKSQK